MVHNDERLGNKIVSSQETIRIILASHTWPPIAPTALTELLRFLCLVSIGESGTERLVSRELDEIWHAIILDTRLYRSICLALPGKKFIDHESGIAHSLPSEGDMQKSIQSMIAYVQHFGPFTQDVLLFWPAVLELASAFKVSLAEFNNRLVLMGQLVLEVKGSSHKA